ncbi:hypothetical protein NDU88_007034 [Pleurodeles waltl]|uniref:Uncharacterized protein n=1 Tax=Pleurodeles waltl TaxID=8319 RepID=A0AAV7RN85_PLEWA|nr:hypothetical protein NDU88_007034 [Pleurodeles waltl]
MRNAQRSGNCNHKPMDVLHSRLFERLPKPLQLADCQCWRCPYRQVRSHWRTDSEEAVALPTTLRQQDSTCCITSLNTAWRSPAGVVVLAMQDRQNPSPPRQPPRRGT